MDLVAAVRELALPATSERQLVVDLANTNFFCGLFNQLHTLSGLIVVGHMLRATLIVRGFHHRLDQPMATVPLSTILNLAEVNRLCTTLQLRTSIREWQGENYPTLNKGLTGPLANYVQQLSAAEPQLDLKMSYHPVLVQHTEGTAAAQLFKHLVWSLPFSTECQRVSERIRDRLQLVDYHAMHLRLEADTEIFSRLAGVDYHSWLQDLRERYYHYLKSMSPNNPVYLATGLTEAELTPWLQHFPQLRWKPRQWRSLICSTLPEGREIDAVIDYLIALQARSFISYPGSSFSYSLNVHFVWAGKPFAPI
jgi:hypothetical protein